MGALPMICFVKQLAERSVVCILGTASVPLEAFRSFNVSAKLPLRPDWRTSELTRKTLAGKAAAYYLAYPRLCALT
jgi:hypothetical protein